MTMWKNEKLELLPIEDTSRKFFVRMSGSAQSRQAEVENLFGEVQIVEADGVEGEFGFITGEMTEGEYGQKAAEAGGILHMIRIEE